MAKLPSFSAFSPYKWSVDRIRFLVMYIGKQVMEGNFRMVLITVVCNTLLIFGNSILFYIQNKYQTYLSRK